MKCRALVMTLVASFGLSACSVFDGILCAPECEGRTHNSSSLVDFLYPNGEMPPAEDAIPELRVPLRVGLAFLPSQDSFDGPALDAAHKEALLQQVRQRFADRKFVGEIVVIPDYYLTTQRGFEGLEGVQRLYKIDVMALISYDQVTHTDDNNLSLGYITIVGAYVLKGSSHDTSTLVDLAVVHPATRSLVLRAGGTDTRRGNTTLAEQERDSRFASAASFDAATERMIGNFDVALKQFEADVKAGKANVRVVQRNAIANTGGGGSLDVAWLLLLSPLAVWRYALRRRALVSAARVPRSR